MNAPRHIVVATYFSEPSERATEVALALAQSLGSRLTLVHVHSTPSYYGYGEGLSWPSGDLARDARRRLDDAVRRTAERWSRVDGTLASGDTVEQILAVAERSGADLVVVGTHGRRGLSRALLGSVAGKVVRMSHVPVLTVGAPAREPRA